MQNPRMIVLGLLGIGLKYAYEMESFAKRTDLRRWGKIGMSTIYKALSDLVKSGAVDCEIIEGVAGPPRKSYTLNKSGRNLLESVVLDSMKSTESPYSDRVAALVFIPLLRKSTATTILEETIKSFRHSYDEFDKAIERQGDDPIADIVINYHRDVHLAEIAAMEKMLKLGRATRQ